jgi:adenylate cyclase
MVVCINVGSNLAGFFLVQVLLSYAHPAIGPRGFSPLGATTNLVLLAILVPIAILILLKLAQPVKQAVEVITRGGSIPPNVLDRARRRSVNLPFQAAAMNMVAWIVPAVAFPLLAASEGIADGFTTVVFALYAFTNAVMVTLLAFVILEHACHRRIIPLLFPDGRIHDQKGTVQLRIRHRLMIMYGAVCLIPMLQTALVINGNALHPWTEADPGAILQNLGSFALILFGFTALYGLWLVVLISRNLAGAAEKIIDVTQKIEQGDYDCRVPVMSNDEIGYLGDRINEMTQGLKEREEIRRIFNLFTSPEIGKEILSRGTRIGGETRRVTLLFSDLRGFTGMAERMPPERVMESINDYFNEMSAAITGHGGIVLQYVGDEIEAVFGAPHDDPDHPDHAVSAAFEMRARLRKLNERRNARKEEPLRHGIGIHTGMALAGIVGSRYKISYAMVGDTVNIASRIQGLTKTMETDVLLSAETYGSLSLPVKVSGPVTVSVKGKADTIDVFRLDAATDRG